MSKLQIIPDWDKTPKMCYFCHDNRSVKYRVKIKAYNPRFTQRVFACNRCALTYSFMFLEMEGNTNETNDKT